MFPWINKAIRCNERRILQTQTIFVRSLHSVCLAFICLAHISLGAQEPAPGILREVFLNIPGASVDDLTNSPNYPDLPDEVEVVTDLFEAPTDAADNYGQRMQALLQPPVSGAYTFWIASDDGGALYLSTDENPVNRRMIASVPGWTSAREWGKYSEQESTPIVLEAGKQYYMEALMKEQGGGDNLAVGWRLPNGTLERPLNVTLGGTTRLFVFGLGEPEITEHPDSQTVEEGLPVVFEVRASRGFEMTYQWQRDEVDLPGETDRLLILHQAQLEDDQARFRCVLTNPYGTVTSDEAVLTVVGDNTPPRIERVSQLGAIDTLTVRFTKPIDPDTAENPAHYQLTPSLTVHAARILPDAQTVLLTIEPLQIGTPYALSASGIFDQASTPNVIDASDSLSFTIQIQPLDISVIRGARERIGPSTRRGGIIVSEIHYHPLPQESGANLQFIELFNTHDWPENISGFKFEGALNFTFPEGTILPTRGFVVVAPDPAAVEAHYGITGVLGGTASLPEDEGTIRFISKYGGTMLEAEYSAFPPYPAAAAGAGHSLILARPSYGEGEHEAWAASDWVGGTPGAHDTPSTNPYATVLINEFLAHTDEPMVDFIELYNYSNQPVDLSGCTLSDRPNNDKFTIPNGTILSPMGFLSFTEMELGFALSTVGEAIYLRSPDGRRVIDALIFGAQDNAVSYGRYPDGSPTFSELGLPTPGAANVSPMRRPIVINEIMFHPISHLDEDSYVELYNRSDEPVDVSGWRLVDGIRYTIPDGTVISAKGYLVVAKDAAKLRSRHPHLNEENCVGNFSGRLSRQGERIALLMADITTQQLADGSDVVVPIDILVDEVRYSDGGRWGQWADGDGSSIELIDPESDNRFASNWADSDETGKSEWTTVEITGVLDNGRGPANQLFIWLDGPGEVLVDDVEVVGATGQNLITNGGFEDGMTGWFAQGAHSPSSVVEGGYQSGHALQIRTSHRGDNGSNRIRRQLNTPLNSGMTATIRAKVRWLRGTPEIVLRLKGGYLEAVGHLQVPPNLGTPGAPNSRLVPNAGPAIYGVTHSPALPSANQPVTVRAQVQDPDGLAALSMVYRTDPSTNEVVVPMVYNGAGFFTAMIPGQPAGRLLAFHIRATDASDNPVTTRFPAKAPVNECLVRFGESQPTGNFGTYRIWMTDAIFRYWSSRLKMDNSNLDVTYVYNGDRVVYNAGSRYSGSPFLSPGYNTPTGALSGYAIEMPKDDRVLGVTDFKLDWPIRDNTLQREQFAYWIAEQLGLPGNYRRFIHLHVNGVRRGTIFEDCQQPNSEMLEQWWPEDSDGDLYKIEDWFEFDNTGNREFNVDATLQNFTTTGGEKKRARYRFNWRKRATDQPNNYQDLFDLVDAVNVQGSAYTDAVLGLVDLEQWMRTFAVRRIVGDWDAYGYNRGKNMYIYKGQTSPWKMMNWDIDFVLGAGSDSPTTGLFHGNDPTITRMYNHPPFRRIYLRAFHDAVHGPLRAEVINPLMDQRHSGIQANAINPPGPSPTKQWVAERRAYILSQLTSAAANFAVTSPTSGSSTSAPLLQMTGTAPVQVRTLRVNDVPYPVEWTGVTNWRIRLPMQSGLNTFLVTGYDSHDELISGFSQSLNVMFTGPEAFPEDHLVINEIMHSPATPGAAFVEIYNTSTTHAFDLTQHRLAGVNFNFTPGTIIGPDSYLVIAEDAAVFTSTYGPSIPLAGQYPGRLQPGGERLRLVKLDEFGEVESILAEVTYGAESPWPVEASSGSSLQLIDPRQDNGRVGNWGAIALGEGETSRLETVPITQNWTYHQTGSLTGTAWRQPDFNDTAWPSGAALLYVENSALPAPKSTALTLGQTTYYFRTTFTNPFPAQATVHLNARTVVDDGCVLYLNGQEVLRLGMPDGNITGSTFATRVVDNAVYEGPFELPANSLVPGRNVLAASVHQVNAGSSDIVWGMTLDLENRAAAPYTPGARNSTRVDLPEFPPLWINEVLARNTTGATDAAGEREPWIELYHAGDLPLALADFQLRNTADPTLAWSFPAEATIEPGGFILVWADGQPEQSTDPEWHTHFRLDPSAGEVFLSRTVNGQAILVDHLAYRNAMPDQSLGRFPDGNPEEVFHFHLPTPAATNTLEVPVAVDIKINEWLASNTRNITNPVDDQFDDWFELYNAGTAAVDLTGYFLSDKLDNITRYQIPPGFVIQSGGYLLVWADGNPDYTVAGQSLHVNFSLASAGEAIGLYAPDQTPVDVVVFGEQLDDVSQGRLPDGGSEPFHFFEEPTPGAANRPSIEGPVLDPSDFTFLPDGSLVLGGAVISGRTYRLEYTDDLGSEFWILLLELLAEDGHLEFVDPLEDAPEQRFYRLLEVNP